ncbi:hypothetical protein SAMN04488144_116134 [Methylobacterium sp. 190mf]|nr:hypothetical protein SAMN04488144_116134 [Methylobacterium sp. 190mf]
MTAMTAREFADLIAVPNVYEFMEKPSQRCGYNACLAVYHVGDYLKPIGRRRADDVHQAMEQELGAPFLALQRMADAVKHREKIQGKTGAEILLMQSGSDTERPATGFGMSEIDGKMNPGDGRPGNPLRFDDHGGRYIEDRGVFYDMLDLCVIVLRAYAKLYPSELAGSAIDGLRYNPAEYAR